MGVKFGSLGEKNVAVELSWVQLFCNWQSVSQSVSLGFEPLCDSWPDFSWS